MQPLIKGVAVIFGSYAKGIQKDDSDLDVFVVGKADEDAIDKVSKMYKVEISLKIYPKFKKDILTKEVIKDHIILKDVEQFVEGVFDGQD